MSTSSCRIACGESTERPSTLVGFFGRLVDAWRTASAMRELESLPFEVRKDIGWPGGN